MPRDGEDLERRGRKPEACELLPQTGLGLLPTLGMHHWDVQIPRNNVVVDFAERELIVVHGCLLFDFDGVCV